MSENEGQEIEITLKKLIQNINNFLRGCCCPVGKAIIREK
jgi:hypothetical protein